eukprot:1684407-Lingulodinium_polyedra.AAC.1
MKHVSAFTRCACGPLVFATIELGAQALLFSLFVTGAVGATRAGTWRPWRRRGAARLRPTRPG